MTYTADTLTEAEEIAKLFRSFGWAAEIVAPLFDGDTFRINATP